MVEVDGDLVTVLDEGDRAAEECFGRHVSDDEADRPPENRASVMRPIVMLRCLQRAVTRDVGSRSSGIPGEARLFPRLLTVTGAAPNLLELVFLDAELAGLMADHELEQVRLVSQFRAHCTEWPDPGVARLVESLETTSVTPLYS